MVSFRESVLAAINPDGNSAMPFGGSVALPAVFTGTYWTIHVDAFEDSSRLKDCDSMVSIYDREYDTMSAAINDCKMASDWAESFANRLGKGYVVVTLRQMAVTKSKSKRNPFRVVRDSSETVYDSRVDNHK